MTNHKAELESAEGQSVEVIMNAAIDSATLACKALCVDDTGSPLPCNYIKPMEDTKASQQSIKQLQSKM